MSVCRVCASDNPSEIEDIAAAAVDGRRSWSSVARELEFPHHAGIKNHMENHWTPPAVAEEQDFAAQAVDLTAKSIAELTEQMALAPAEVKPFYLVAIHNLRELRLTKPSQKDLLAALKGIHEVTGMKLEQRLMLDYARSAFGGAEPKLALEPSILDVESEEVYAD